MKIYRVSDNRTLLERLLRPKMIELFFEDEGDVRRYMSMLPHGAKITTINVLQGGSVHV